MKITYKPLWKLLIDRNMSRTKFAHVVGIASSTLAKMGNNEQVSMGTLLKICDRMGCDLKDVVAFERDNAELVRAIMRNAFTSEYQKYNG